MWNIKAVINRRRDLFNGLQLAGSRSPLPVPALVMTHLTLACQCRCPMCYQKDADFPWASAPAMPIERFEQILDQARWGPLRPLIHLYGGEPLMAPHLPAVLDRLERSGHRATVNTNGEWLERWAPRLAHSRVRMINVSLDAFGAAHDELRVRDGLFERAMAGLKTLRRLDASMRLNVNYVVTARAADSLYDDVVAFEKHLKGTRLDYFSIEHLAFTRDTSAPAGAVDTRKLVEQLRRVTSRQFDFPVSATPVVSLEDVPAYYGSVRALGPLACNVPWLGLNVMPTGEVTPGGAMYTCAEVVGHLDQQSLGEVWRGRRMRDFRHRIRTAMPEACQRCCHVQHRARRFTSRLER